jgi:hypothetical protein
MLALERGFSNCGMHTPTATPTTVYWYADLIKSRYKRTDISLKKVHVGYITSLIYIIAGSIT